MTTRLEVEYDRQFTDSEVQALIARATVTASVLQQLGVAYQNLPGYALAAYQTEISVLLANIAALQALLDQIRPLLILIDNQCGPIDDKNKALLRTLDGLLKTDADRALLTQITGPTAQSPPPTPVPPPPGP